MRLTKLFFMALLLLPVALSAQVTIGIDRAPQKGALLQLQNLPDGNSTKGLLMPRVTITDLTSLADINKGQAVRPDPAEHVGLVVYNPIEGRGICSGLFAWTGTQWQYLQPEIEYFEDVRTFADGVTKERIKYPIRTFGSAGTWMLANLRATTYADNLGVNKPADDLVTPGTGGAIPKSYYYPALDPSLLNADKYPELGLVYTWAAATNGKGGFDGKQNAQNEGESAETTSGPNPIPANVEQVGKQGVCPEGWHLPSDKEWNDLEEAIANEQTGLYTRNEFKPTAWDVSWRLVPDVARNTVDGHGKSMKNYDVKLGSYAASGASKTFCNGGGFNLMLSGYVSDTGSYGGSLGREGRIWSHSASSGSSVWTRILTSTSSGVSRGRVTRGYHSAVRCKRN